MGTCPPKTVYRWIKEGKLEAVQFGPRTCHVPEDAISKFPCKAVCSAVCSWQFLRSCCTLPYFFDPGSIFYRTVGIFWFSAFSFAAVLIYTWVFNRTKGSLSIVTLLHASQNAWSNILSDNSLRPFQFAVALMWMIALLLIVTTVTSSRSRKSDVAKNEQEVGAGQ